MEAAGRDLRWIGDILATLSPAEPARLAFLRRAPEGIRGRSGTLLCLSASFNPMTVAHAALIREGGRLIPAQEVLLLLASINVDKRVAGLPLAPRLDLLLRFAESRPELSVAAVGHGRFVDKIEAIRAAYPARTRVVFLLGFDTVIRLFDAKYYADRDASLSTLFSHSECAVANRGAEVPGHAEAFLTRVDVLPFAHRIHVVRLPADLADVSATAVRARLSRGESITGLVPSEIQVPLEQCWHAHQRP